MAIAFAEVQTGTQTGGTSTVSASMGAGGSDSFYLAFVALRSNVAVTGVTGLSLTWTPLNQQCGARAQQGIELYYAYGSGASGAVTATHTTCAASVIAVLRYTGVDSSTPYDHSEGHNTLGVNGVCTGGTDDDDCDATTSFTTATDGWLVGGFDTRNRAMSATAGFNVRVNDVAAGTGGDITALTVEDRLCSAETNPTVGAVNNLTGTADWCLLVVDIHPAAAAATAVPNALMMMGAGT